MLNLTRTAAVELAPHHIRVNAVNPGAVRTPLAKMARLEELVGDAQPWPDVGEPEQIASVICFLAGDDARFITGVDHRRRRPAGRRPSPPGDDRRGRERSRWCGPGHNRPGHGHPPPPSAGGLSKKPLTRTYPRLTRRLWGVAGEGMGAFEVKGFLGTVVACLLSAVAAAGLPETSVGAVGTGWRSFALTGLPDTAILGSVAAGPQGFAAAGADDIEGDDRNGFVVWRSPDGMAWKEAYRDSSRFPLGAQVMAVGGGFAAVSSGCRLDETTARLWRGMRCEPIAVASADGTRWERSEVGTRTAVEPSGTPSIYLWDLAEGPDGSLLAVGWAETRPGDPDPAVWRSPDGGKTWALSGNGLPPATSGRPDGMTSLVRTDQGWLAAGFEELEHSGDGAIQFSQQEPRLWRSRDAAQWERADPPNRWGAVHHVARSGSAVYLAGSSARGVSIWRASPDGGWSSTDDGFPDGPPSSLSVLEGGPDGLVVAGVDSADGTGRPAVWGSPDGATFRRTLEAPRSTSFVAAVRSSDEWFLYGTVSAPRSDRSALTGWVASSDCATGRPCGGLSALDEAGRVLSHEAP